MKDKTKITIFTISIIIIPLILGMYLIRIVPLLFENDPIHYYIGHIMSTISSLIIFHVFKEIVDECIKKLNIEIDILEQELYNLKRKKNE